MSQLFDTLCQGHNLTHLQIEQLFREVIQGQLDPHLLAGVLTALKIKGETPEEISGAATALLDYAVEFPHTKTICADNCGTGGDGSSTFNISTTAAIVAASCGVPMVKHGNRSISSKSGSADLLEQLGINIQLSPQAAYECLTQVGITFLFAPQYHTGIKYAMPVRKGLKTRTLFNLLGPLLNPAKPKIQLLGVYDPNILLPVARAIQLLGIDHAMIVHGSGMDEIAIHGETQVVEIDHDTLRQYHLSPTDFGLKTYNQESIRGGTAQENAAITQAILSGKGKKAHNAAINANVGALLYLAGKAKTLKEGAEISAQALASRQAEYTLQHWINFCRQQAAIRT